MKFLILLATSILIVPAITPVTAQAARDTQCELPCLVLQGEGNARGKLLAILGSGRALFDQDDLPYARITPTIVRLDSVHEAVPELAGIHANDIVEVRGELLVVNAVFSNGLVEFLADGFKYTYVLVSEVQPGSL